MDKGIKLSIRLLSGMNDIGDYWKYYLPANSNAIMDFMEPLSISIKSPIQKGPLPKDTGRAMKIFVDNGKRWQDSQELINAFMQLWPSILKLIAGLSKETVDLVYFSGQATQTELLSLWPFLPFEFGNNNRFFVSEIRKLNRTHNSVPIWFCVEYSHDFFTKLTCSEECQFSYGTTVMGMSVVEPQVDSYLQKDLIDKTILENVLREKFLRCWWLCDPDFEGMIIWHKDYSGKDLMKNLIDVVKKEAKKIGLRID